MNKCSKDVCQEIEQSLPDASLRRTAGDEPFAAAKPMAG